MCVQQETHLMTVRIVCLLVAKILYAPVYIRSFLVVLTTKLESASNKIISHFLN